MGSTNAILKYKPCDQYSEYEYQLGKYNDEIIEVEYYGISYKAIFPCRDFCLLVGYTALEGSKNGCIIIDDKGLIYIYDGNLIKRYMRLNELGI
jgi:hypothetical protein